MKARYFNPFAVPKGHKNVDFKKLFGAEAGGSFHNTLLPLKDMMTCLDLDKTKQQVTNTVEMYWAR